MNPHHQQPSNKSVDLNTVIITSERLILRPIEITDAEFILQEFNERVTRYMSPGPATSIDNPRNFIKESIEKRQKGLDLTLAITNKTNDEMLGVCGLHLEPDGADPDLGLWLKESAQGNAYGKEAIIALIKWASSNKISNTFRYPVDRDNKASVKIPQALNGEIIEEQEFPTERGVVLNIVIYKITVNN